MYVFVISILKMGKKLEKIVGDNCSVSLRHEKNKYDNNNYERILSETEA